MLKQLMLRKKIATLTSQLEAFRITDAALEIRSAQMKTREAELEAAINDLTDTATEEEKTTVDEATTAFEVDQKTLADEVTGSVDGKKKLEDEIRDLTKELDAIETKAPAADPDKPAAERKDESHTMKRRTREFFKDMGAEARSLFMARQDVKDFITRVRELMTEKRSITGVELTIPEVMLETLRDNLHRYSKLINYVMVRTIKGKARQNIMGAIPEAIWTEACKTLNELTLSFSQVEVDGFMIAGFIAIPNATLEDSDEDLAAEILDALGQGMGLGVDKSIIYGTGVKMPLGFITRLAQTAKPSDWNENGPAWADLHTTHILKIDPAGMTPETFFSALVLDLGVADNTYASGNTFWCANRKTKMSIMAKMISFNAAGALVAGATGTMPIEGGAIIELPFIPDNDIVGGFGSVYLLAERSGAQLAQSTENKFIEDQTVFKGKSRYDGIPVFGESFLAVNIANAAPTTTILFPQDVANTVATPQALPIAGAYVGAQSVALSCATPDAKIYYTVDGSTPTASKTLYNGPITVAATKTIKAIGIKTGMTSSAVFEAAYTIS